VISHNKGGILESVILLTVAIAAGWILAFWPARVVSSDSDIMWMSVAAVTCLIPGWIVLALSFLSVFANDLSAMVVQSMVRLGSVALVAVLVRKQRPDLGFADFFGWLVGFYLLALLTEVLLLRRSAESKINKNAE
jgi:hypothetical protein